VEKERKKKIDEEKFCLENPKIAVAKQSKVSEVLHGEEPTETPRRIV
jgi:hypothetical protein